MGMFDSFHIACPNCKHELEFQSKSGACALDNYTKDDLPVEVAVGINGDIVRCEFCLKNWKLRCELPEIVKVTIEETDKKENYNGNHNPKLPENIKRIEELKKMMEKKND